MATKNKNIPKLEKTFLVTAVFLMLILLGYSLKPAASVIAIESDCNLSTDKEKCEELKKKAEDYQDIIEIKEKTEKTLESQLQILNTQQAKNEVELDKTKDKVDELSGKISELEQQIRSQEKQIDHQKTILSGLMQSYYADYQQGLLPIVLASQNFSDILSQSDYLAHSSLKVSDILAAIKENKARLDKQKNDLDSKKLESEKLKKELEDKNLNLQYTENKKVALLGQTQAEKEKYQKLLDDIENEIYSLEANLSLSVDWSKLPLGKSGYMHWPVNPHVITQGYGKTSFARTSGIYKNNFHNGIDLSVSYKGVFAVRGGKVVGSGDNGKYAYGKWIAIDHGDGLVSLYGHLSKQLVSKGQRVSDSQQIGVSGNTGKSTGPHLHFSIFASKSFRVTESSFVKGLMIPTGASTDPRKYL